MKYYKILFPGVAQLTTRLLWVRLRARPVDDTASITKRSGQNSLPLQGKKNFGHRKRAAKAVKKVLFSFYNSILFPGVAQLVARLLWERVGRLMPQKI